MKLFITTVGLYLISCIAYAQSFEGKIIYHNTYKSKSPNINDKQYTDMLGDTQKYSIKGGNYKSEVNGRMILWQLYNAHDGRIYSKMSITPTVLFNDESSNKDEVLSSEIHKNAAIILGYKCDELLLQCKSGVQKYYYSSKLPVDSKLYANHKFGNWNVVMAKINAVPLKMEIDNNQLTLISVATEIKPMKINNSFFELPANTPVQKSSY
ncbi:hypothetical protein KHS38_07685 [Mucilaginibacter sp. Bleaf8]|uniref:hypothetical protein n=1 Tax=Mucilaginibacter sp. Bleaf8 TaxID=2834430 RepID=UPI001BCE003D|nr:hypothetical protein [Mucilaginibacter sp. Bleaf8]MBS7564283.1 hypothetical protein [Mucilaginibacter sp. Bleaf8]